VQGGDENPHGFVAAGAKPRQARRSAKSRAVMRFRVPLAAVERANSAEYPTRSAKQGF